MKRRFLAAVLGITLLTAQIPVPVLAQEETMCPNVYDETCGYTEAADEIPENTVDSKESDSMPVVSEIVTNMQTMIDNLPAVEAVRVMEMAEQSEIYNQAQAVYGEYEKLTEEEQIQVNIIKLENLFTYFNSLTAVAAGPIQITTEQDLKNISGSNSYILMNDITLNGSWTPISSFSGTLDGNGHRISGLSINSSSSTLGFINTLNSGGTVKNLIISGSVVSNYNSNAGRVGGIVGINYGTITGCTFYGAVSQKQGDNQTVGGIAGLNNGTISGCSNYGNISGISKGGGYNAVYVGGITGSNHGTVEISNCANHGTITGSVPNTNTHVGDIWGSSSWQSNGAYVGGIAGDTNKTNAPGCSNDGLIIGENSNADTNLISIISPGTVILDEPVPADELNGRLPQTVKLETSQGERVGSVVWDTTAYDASAENINYNFSGTVTLPENIKNPSSVSLTITIQVQVGGAGPVSYLITLPNGEGYTLTGDTTASQGEEKTYTFTLDAANGYYKTSDFAVKVNGEKVSLDNNSQFTLTNITENKTVTVEGVAKDDIKPAAKITVGEKSYTEIGGENEEYFNTTQTVTVEAGDNESGLDKVYYLLSDKILETEEMEDAVWTSIGNNGTFDINPAENKEEEHIVYVKAVDKAGNITYVSTNVLVFDKAAPVINDLTEGDTCYGDTKFTVSDKYLDFVSVDGKKVTPDADGKYVIIADNGEHKVIAADKAGNSTARTVTVHEYFTVTYKTNTGVEIGTLKYGVKESNVFPTSGFGSVFPEFFERTQEKGKGLWIGNGGVWFTDSLLTEPAVMPDDPKAGDNYIVYANFSINASVNNITATNAVYGEKNLPSHVGVDWSASRNDAEIKFVFEKKQKDGSWTTVPDSYYTDLNGTEWDNMITLRDVADSGTYRLKYLSATVCDNENIPLFTQYAYLNLEVEAEVTPKPITIKGVTAVDRVYDGTTVVELTGGTLEDVLAGDNVSFELGHGTVADNNAGNGKIVTTAITLTGDQAANYSLIQPADIKVNITNGVQDAPMGVSSTDETIDGKKDGTLTNVDDTMEYRMEGETEYKAISSSTVTGLADGKYYVRYKAKTNYDASKDAEVEILQGRMLTVVFKADDDVVENQEVSWNGSITKLPKIPEKTGYNQTAPYWEKTIEELTNIQEDIVVTAVYTINTYPIILTEGSGYKLEAVNSTDSVEHGGSFSFKLTISQGYSKTENFAVKINGVKAEPEADGIYTAADITEVVTVTVEGIADITVPVGEITVKENSWREFINNVTFGLFFKSNQEVTITAADNGSGVRGIEYYITKAGMTSDEVKAITNWSKYTNSFHIKPNGEYVIYAKITDNSGNVTYISSDGMVLDNIVPVILGIENGRTYCEAVKFSVDEKYVGTVTINGIEAVSENGIFTVVPQKGSQLIVVTDKAGNRTQMMIVVNDGHTFTKYVSDKNASYTSDGTKTAKCDFCDALHTVVDKGTKLSHTYGEGADTKGNPATGDNNILLLWFMLMAVSGVTVTVIYDKKKKH